MGRNYLPIYRKRGEPEVWGVLDTETEVAIPRNRAWVQINMVAESFQQWMLAPGARAVAEAQWDDSSVFP